MANDLLASMVLAIWLYLLAGRGRFWLAGERDDAPAPGQGPWPAIAAIIPARDEAESVGETVTSLLRQEYPGEFAVIVVDDQSRDATAEVARAAAAALGAAQRLTVLSGRALAPGWTGKLWAQHQGVELAESAPQPPAFLLFTDADIVYAADAACEPRRPGAVRRLCADFADGEAALPKPCRAHVRSRFHLLLPDALPVLLGERSAPRHRRGGRRLHAGASRRACARPAAWQRSAPP